MSEFEDLKREVAVLQKAVLALVLGQPITYTERGHVIALDEGFLACSIEGRNPHAVVAGIEPWCRIHGFNCPNFGAKR